MSGVDKISCISDENLTEVSEIYSLDDLNSIMDGIGNEIFEIIDNKNISEITKFEALLIKDILNKFNTKYNLIIGLSNVYIERGTHAKKILSDIID